MAGRAHDLQFVVATAFALQAGHAHRRLNQANIERMCGDGVADHVRIADRQPDAHLRITHIEFAEDRRQHELGNRRAGSNEQAAAHLPGHFGDTNIQFGGQPEDALGVVEDQIARRSQRDAPPTAIEEAGIEALFKLLDLKGHGRLRHVQRFTRLGERKVLGHSVKNLQATIRHKSSPCYGLFFLFNHKTGLPAIDRHRQPAAHGTARAVAATVLPTVMTVETPQTMKP
jgi:hypothetical protein